MLTVREKVKGFHVQNFVMLGKNFQIACQRNWITGNVEYIFHARFCHRLGRLGMHPPRGGSK